MEKNTNNDFNLFFWKILGVNKRVFQSTDTLDIKRNNTADRKRYSNYLKNTNILPIEKANFENLEILIFRDIMTQISNKNENITFYTEQLILVILNYKLALNMPTYLKRKIFHNINVLAFTIAILLEHMKHKGYTTTIFKESIQNFSLEPFLDFAKIKFDVRDDIGLAQNMSHELENTCTKLAKKEETYNIRKKIPITYKKDISNWRKKKELPRLIDISILAELSIREDKNAENNVYFLQLLITRGLLYLDNKYNLKKEFLNKFENYKLTFNKIFENDNNQSKLLDYQEKYKIFNPYPNILENEKIVDVISLMFNNLKYFCEDGQYRVSSKLNEQKTKDFFINKKYVEMEKLFNKKKYSESLKILKDADIDELGLYTFTEFLLEVKLKNKKRIKKLLKKLDSEQFSGLLTLGKGNYQSEQYIMLIEDINSLEECSDKIRGFIEKNCLIFSNYTIKNSSIIFSS